MDLTIIIPNYNNSNLLKELLESIQKIINVKYHIIIVDNGSTDNSIQTIQKYPNINLIKNKENKGFAYAVNQAIKETKTDYVLLLNNDVVIKEDTAEILLKTIKEDPNIFAVSSKIIQYHNRNLLDDAGDEYNLLGWSKRTGYNQNIEKYNTFREIFSACAAASIYNKNILCQIGLFDEKFFAYVEDMDVCFRAKINGYKCLYNPNAIAYHHGSATTKSRYNPFKVKISARNNIYLIYKNMPYWMIIINIIFIILGIIIKLIFFTTKKQQKYYIAGIKEGLKTLHTIKRNTNGKLKNYISIECQMIKNTFTYVL